MRLLITGILSLAALAAAPLLANAGLAEACAGLIGSNGAVNLGRTTTLAGYHDGVEHYVTAFEFQGGGGEFGTLIPLPAVPSKVERGGDWTLQRLQRETQVLQERAAFGALAADAEGVEILQEVRIDALDITVLKGGAPDVAVWAQEHGFRLSPDAPEVLDFYARRSPIFLAAVFDGEAAAARGQQLGDGTPVHITMPTNNPWVPLRILGLGKQAEDFVQADVYLLTDDKPALLPAPNEGLFVTHNDRATDLLLDDLRADAGMGWVPESGWLTKLEVNSSAADLRYDLAVDTTDARRPSRVAAGLELPNVLFGEDVPRVFADLTTAEPDSGRPAVYWAAIAAGVLAVIAIVGLGLRPVRDRR
jgi:Uncharacterized protein conserved in bacteria (DUF2330)